VIQPSKNERTILIGEDELEVRRYLEMAVRSFGYTPQSARDGDEVLSLLHAADTEPCAILLDLVMPNRGGLDTLREIRAVDAKLPVILISGLSSIQQAVAAMKFGATDFLVKPVTHDDLGRVLAVALENGAIENGNAAGKPAPRNLGSPGFFVGSNAEIREVQARAARIGWSGAPVLIQGETGSGKEVLARELHSQSARANKPFLKLNCAALPSELVESELFGYERGAFTGAFQKKAGMFELADGGTILLDEIGDMDVRLQAKLLQVLQDQEFRRVGGKDTVRVDVRIMAATHRDLEKAIHDGTFREDLYYRLNVIAIQLPPLRERPEDIVPLGEILLKKHAPPGAPLPPITMDLRRAMMDYSWPGNVRELENCMRKLFIFQDADAIRRDLQARIDRKPPRVARQPDNHVVSIGRGDSAAGRADGISVLEQVTKVKQQAETDAILAALNSTRWNRKQAASVLKVDYKSLLYKMKKLGIDENPVSLADRPSHRPEAASA
jgi:two-component system, NtrC family, response regulator AtoC